ncbi:hypothetical protein DSL72_002185 [Monilinia vaccinii-corymbosi]|uniref:Uncharacterized protein n=1 Tax=Monilinia vaccinii-corymbosi TaxID=61207 RepID=A0A8A3PBW3_9HELO|nr:hypothetical protein DSL72_002185 [Monilinia vaccinii-corymbosi]
MHLSIVTIFGAVLMGTVVAAQTSSVVDLFLIALDYDAEDQNQVPFVGSIIASDATATTYSITCGSTTVAPATPSSSYDSGDECGIPDGFMFTQGPSTIQYLYTANYSDDGGMTDSDSGSSLQPYFATYALGCVLAGTSSAYCSATDIESAASTTYTSADTTALTGTELATLLAAVPVTITAGPKSTAASAAKMTSGASESTSATRSASSSASASAASTGGMPMITAKAQWVVGGAAAAMVMAAL